ncbi:hypothetical protein NQ317_001091 [Molorchus minor]|uniref:Reverse transcriptase domain-containing protein n=1 Tax=Molorchus minor TaxID=1323400 RepID=A0ABQ9IQQ0_9CUCU|nr:hypothetical protein NQ317_001091 [Molorchus minor]
MVGDECHSITHFSWENGDDLMSVQENVKAPPKDLAEVVKKRIIIVSDAIAAIVITDAIAIGVVILEKILLKRVRAIPLVTPVLLVIETRAARDTLHLKDPVQVPSGDPSPAVSNKENEDEILILNNDAILDREILQALGEDSADQGTPPFELHPVLQSRWNSILSKGMNEEERVALLEKHPLPTNVDLLCPPKLNPELLPAITSFQLTRDKHQVRRQEQLGRGLAALGRAMNALLKNSSIDNKEARNDILANLGESAKLFTDLHHNMSLSRRAGIIPLVDKSLKQLTSDTPELRQPKPASKPPLKSPPRRNFTGRPLNTKAPSRSAGSRREPRYTRGALQLPQKETTLPDVDNQVSIAGRLRNFHDIWQTLTPNQVVLNYIKGYKIPFYKTPWQRPGQPRTISSTTNDRDILNELAKLIEIGAVVRSRTSKNEFISPTFLVKKPNGKMRFILNLKNLNKYVKKNHFKMEDTRTAMSLISKGCYMATIDLRDAYFLISVHKESRKFLKFRVNQKLYSFTCLPFGLSSAPYVFSKVVKPVLKYLREKGVHCVAYLDDFLILGSTPEEGEANVTLVIHLLESLGFLINREKSMITPSQRCKFLGFVFDSMEMTLELTIEKRQKILCLIKQIKTTKFCKIRTFSQFIGLLISACPAIKYGKLYTKSLERAKFLSLRNCNQNYNKTMTIPSYIREDLDWWDSHILSSKNQIREDSFSCIIYTDASKTGWGAYCDTQATHGWWNQAQAQKHINYLELLAVFYGLGCFAQNYSDCNILLRVDNTTALSYINRMGSIKYPELNSLARKIWQWCEKRNLWVFASYIESKENIADEDSRVLSVDTEWELSNIAFKTNHKLWMPSPYAGLPLNFYAFPPFALILRVLKKIITDQAVGIVIVPNWTTQAWYPLFSNLADDRPYSKSYIGSSEVIRQAFLLKGLPSSALATQMQSLSPATIKQYDVTFRLWWSFCSKNSIHPFKAGVSDIIRFLQCQLDLKPSKYGTFNSHRSALALILPGEIGKDPRIKRFLKAISKIRPQRPKYNVTWDPQIVLNYLEAQGDNKELSLLDLSRKLITLLAITTGHRLQTFFLIKVEDIWFEMDGAKAYIREYIKTSGLGKAQPCLEIPFFNPNRCICPATTLLDYIERTTSLRLEDQSFLFIMSRPPYSRASKNTLGRWITQTLEAAGLNTKIFSPHSTRHASTSLAYRRGVSLDVIRKTAGWSEKSQTFARFYKRPLYSNFAFSVLEPK